MHTVCEEETSQHGVIDTGLPHRDVLRGHQTTVIPNLEKYKELAGYPLRLENKSVTVNQNVIDLCLLTNGCLMK